MGHDIFAKPVSMDEVAYLRRNMSSHTIHNFYGALKATECDGGVSGNGGGKMFFKSDIKEALRILEIRPDADEHDAEIIFLRECLSWFDDEDNYRLCILFG